MPTDAHHPLPACPLQTSFDLSEGAQGYVVALAAGVSVALDPSIALLGVGERSANEDPVDPVWPALALLLLAFFVARSFASVYECVVDTRTSNRPMAPPPWNWAHRNVPSHIRFDHLEDSVRGTRISVA